VVLRDGADATEEDLAEFLSTKVASWQVPDHVEFVESLPKTGVGKLDKRRLRDEVVPGLVEGFESEPSR
jgi:fatty-acyl-CoA synthase